MPMANPAFRRARFRQIPWRFATGFADLTEAARGAIETTDRRRG